MNEQLKPPKKPFPLAGVFLLIYALTYTINNVVSLVNFFAHNYVFYIKYLGAAQVVTDLLSRIPPFLICTTTLILAIVLLVKKSGVGVAVALTAFTLMNGLQFIVGTISNTEYIISNMTAFFSNSEPIHIFHSISALAYISELSFIALALTIVTVIAFLSINPKRCNSFFIKIWAIPLILFILAFIVSGISFVIDIISFLIYNYRFDVNYVLIRCASSFTSFTALLAHIFLAIWFGRLASYRRKLQAYEAAMPIETTATEVPEAPAPQLTVPAPESEPEPESEAEPEVEAEPEIVAEPELSPKAIGELQRLKQLLDAGAITEDDFEALKKKLLG